MVGQVSIEELARRTGEPIGHLRKWRSLGLIGAKGAKGFALEDVETVRLVRLLLRRGVGMEAIQEAAKAGQLGRRLAGYLEWMYPGEAGPTYSVGEAAEELGLSIDLLRRVLEVSGLRDEGERGCGCLGTPASDRARQPVRGLSRHRRERHDPR